MSDVTELLGLSYSKGIDQAETIDETMQAFAEGSEGHLYGLRNTADIQEGVLGSGDGLVTRIGANTVRVAAGSGWVEADGTDLGVAGKSFTGLFPVTWPQTDITIPSTGANKRADRIVIPAVLNGGEATPVRVAGSEAATVDHDTLQSAGALPSGRLQVGTVISSTTGVSASNTSNTGIVDRRPWARGVHVAIRREQNASGGDSYTKSVGGAYDFIDSTNLQFRVECTGNPFLLKLAGVHEHNTAGAYIAYQFRILGVTGEPETYKYFPNANEPDNLHFERIIVPAVGSRLIGPAWDMITGTAKLWADDSRELVFTIDEIITPSRVNVFS